MSLHLPSIGSPLADDVLRLSFFQRPFRPLLNPLWEESGGGGTIDLTTDVTGVLPIANGGTGQSSQTNSFDALSPTTTKGDLIVCNGTDNIRLAVGGSNGYVLAVDATEASGVKWVPASSTPGVGEWDQVIYSTGDQSVTNSTTLVDHSELQFAVTAGSLYRIELLIYYTASASTNDYKWNLHCSAGTMLGIMHHGGAQGTTDAVNVGQQRATVSDLAAAIAYGTGADTTVIRTFWAYGYLGSFSSACTLSYQFAQNASGVGQSSITKAGSLFRAKRIT